MIEKGNGTLEESCFKFFTFIVVLAISAVVGISCDSGDGGSSTAAIQEGRFLDSPVEGIEYETATLSGVTDLEGRFTYREGEHIRFFLGDILLGEALAKTMMTPVDLVQGATDETHPTVTNICRFLQSLDKDGNINNGITISAENRNEIGKIHIDFSLSIAHFETSPDVHRVFDSLNQMHHGMHPGCPHCGQWCFCIGVDDARSHLRATLLEALAGKYGGTFSGDDSGTWSIIIDAQGGISGAVVSDQVEFTVHGTAYSSGMVTVAQSGVDEGFTFEGNIAHSGHLQGTWQNTAHGTNGPFSGGKK